MLLTMHLEYLLPNDEQEQDRLGKHLPIALLMLLIRATDLQHHLFHTTLAGRLHLVRLPLTRRVLDIGTGTGIWSMDFGKSILFLDSFSLKLGPSRQTS
jgi:hypothetical protein